MRKPFLLSLLVALLTSLSIHAYDFKSGNLYYNITSGTTVEVTYQDNSSTNYQGLTTATIPESVTYYGTTFSVTSIGDEAFSRCSSLTSITLPNSVTSIGKEAFRGCSSLTSITIGNSVTSIGNYAFDGCSSLTSVIWNAKNCADWSYESYAPFYGIRANITSFTFGEEVETIHSYLCYGMSSLTSITIPNSVTSIRSKAFGGCSSLTSITIGNSVTSIGNYAFDGCSSLTSVIWNAKNCADWSNESYAPFYRIRANITSFTFGEEVETIHSYLCYGMSSLTSLTLPNSVTSIGNEAFYDCSSLTSITIPNSVTSIGDWAFRDCSSLTSITIPNSVTSIGDAAFWGCSALTSITIPNSVTSIGNSAFMDCSSLTSITLPNSITSIGDYAFMDCSSLTSITLPNSVTSIGNYAFSGCSSLTSITLPNSVTTIGGDAFSYCSALTSITIPNSVTSIEYGAFRSCSALTSITIPNSVTSIGEYAFAYCSSITSITIPNSVTSIGDYAFTDCSALTSITLPNSVTSIGSYAFAYCSSLTSITLPNSVTSIGSYAFAYCSSLTSITLPNSVTSIGDYAFSGCSALTSITIPNSVTSIGNYAFYNCSALTSVTLPNSVTSIGDDAFCGCSALTSIILPNSVTSIGYEAFKRCSSLISITIPNSVTSIGSGAFYGCSSLTSITIPNSVTSIESGAFHFCYSLTSVSLGNSVTSIGSSAFHGCSSLTSITIPNSVTSIGRYAFYGCSALTSITIPYSVTSIGNNAFYGVLNIVYRGTATGSPWGARIVNGYVDGYLVYADETKTHLLACSAAAKGEITIPNSVTSIGNRAFRGCSSLTSLILPNSVTSIGDYAFSGCSALTSITLPNSVTSIGEWAFFGCSSLTSITLPNSVTSIGRYAFEGCSSLTSVIWNAKNCAGWSYESYAPFYDICANITSFTFGEEVETIPSYLCYGMSSLTSIILPNSVTSIEDGVFFWCSSLTSVTSLSCTPPSCGFDVFYDTPSEKTLVVPSISMDAYKNSSPWKYFTSFEKCLSIFVQSSDSTLGTVQIDQEVDCDRIAIISATANYGYHFKQWNDGNTDNPRTIKLTQDTTLTAEFAPNQYILTTIAADAERGTTQGDTIADYLTEIQVSATANYGYHFTQWSDGNTNNPRTISLTKDTNLVALFEKNQYTITTSCNAEQGTISGTQEAEYLDEVTISATANYGYHFTQWSDGNTENPRTFTLTQDTAFAAEFAPNQYTLTTMANYAERGTAQGDTIADYLTEIQVSATANYGYHFTQWSDGNTDNPRTISLTKDTTVVALFDKNQYTITTSCNAEQGNVSKPRTAKYLDEVTISATANLGYHFKQWNDGNTDNPHTIKLTQDTTFVAEFEMDYSGKCGDDLYWAYSNQEIKITGSGAMYNYTESTMPWTLFRDSIMTVRVDSSVTSIGEYAFANTPKLAELHIGAHVETISANAFLDCNRLYHIYCYPVYPPLAVKSSFANYNVYLHIPCEAKEEYTLDLVWGLFKYIECLDSEMGIDDPQVPMENFHQDKIEKIIRNGQVLIIRNGKTYNIMGQRL